MQPRAGGRRSDEGSENQASRKSDSTEVEGEKPFFCWQGVSIYRRGPPAHESRQSPCESFSRGLLKLAGLGLIAVTPRQKRRLERFKARISVNLGRIGRNISKYLTTN